MHIAEATIKQKKLIVPKKMKEQEGITENEHSSLFKSPKE